MKSSIVKVVRIPRKKINGIIHKPYYSIKVRGNQVSHASTRAQANKIAKMLRERNE